MRKNGLLLTVVILFGSLVNAQTAIYDGKLFGKIKSIRLLIYNDSTRDPYWRVADSMVCFYDNNGHQQGKSVMFYFDLRGQITEISTDERDANGKVTKETSNFPLRKSMANTAYIYDQAGSLIKEVGSKSDGTVDYSIVYVYSDGHLIQKQTEQRDPTYPRNDVKLTYQYDAKGKKIESDEYSNDVQREEIRFQYDASGNNTKSIHHFPDPAYGADFEIRYRYDADGNMLTEDKYQPMGVLLTKTTYEYTFDSNNNWTEMKRREIVLRNNHIRSCKKWKKTIEYY